MNKIVGLRKDLSDLLEKYESEVRTKGYAEGFEAGRKYDVVEETAEYEGKVLRKIDRSEYEIALVYGRNHSAIEVFEVVEGKSS